VPDSNLEIRLDPLNPGQFFACCGLFELLSEEEPGLLSHFVVDPRRPRVAGFSLKTSRGSGWLSEILRLLRDATATFPDDDLEAVRPEAPVRPAEIAYGGRQLTLDWWLDEFRDKTVNIKCWAGQVTTRRLLQELLPLLDVDATGEDLFDRSALTSSLFGVDPRSAWNTLDLGFSPNEHGVASTVFPAVEILAAIGLQFFRPNSSIRSRVAYALWKEPLPASVARLAFIEPWDGLQAERLVFEICKRGQSYKYFSFGKSAEKESTNQ
jgi:CRISPR-associated protein Csx14